MTTKQKRPATIEPIQKDTSVNDSLSQSLSPNTSDACWTRQQEKDQLSGLNDRLASYIEKVRNLEMENGRLRVQIRDVVTIERRENENLQVNFEAKIEELRNKIEIISRDKARLEIECSNAVNGHNDIKERVSKLEQDLHKCEDDLQSAQSLANTYQARCNTSESRCQLLEKQNMVLNRSVEDLHNQLEIIRRQLEDEIVLRTEIENKMKAYKDDLEFARKNNASQMEDLRRTRQIDIESVQSDMESQYNTKLIDKIQMVRAESDAQIEKSRSEVDSFYKPKLAEAQESLKSLRQANRQSREEITRHQMRVEELEQTQKEHDAKVGRLSQKIAELESQLRGLKAEFGIKIQDKESLIAELEAEINTHVEAYRELMDIKFKLDTEIRTYAALLNGEETRLGISPDNSPNVSTRSTSSNHASFSDSHSLRGTKRKRHSDPFEDEQDHSMQLLQTKSHTSLDVFIEDVDMHGRFIKLKNLSDNDFMIGQWCLKAKTSDKEITFKFHNRQIIKRRATSTVWSRKSADKHSPPADIQMRHQDWPTDDFVRVELLDATKKVVAWRESTYGLESDGDRSSFWSKFI